MDNSIGVYVIDRFTYYTLEFLETIDQNSKKTINDLVNRKTLHAINHTHTNNINKNETFIELGY